MLSKKLCAGLSLAFLAFSAQAGEPALKDRLAQPIAAKSWDEDVFFSVGRFQSGYFGSSFNPVTADFENNYFLGAGYQRFVETGDWGFRLGYEMGVGLRFGQATSAEIWGGVVGRMPGLRIADRFEIAPALTAGLSAATGLIGAEADRASRNHAEGTLLFYLGPELSLTDLEAPEREYFVRAQHRSGAWGTLAYLDGSNAVTVGMRFKY